MAEGKFLYTFYGDDITVFGASIRRKVEILADDDTDAEKRLLERFPDFKIQDIRRKESIFYVKPF